MKIFKRMLKLIVLLLVLLIIYTQVKEIFFDKHADISSSMFNDSQELLNSINGEFLTYSAVAKPDEDQINHLLDLIEAYGDKYQLDTLETKEEKALFTDMGSIIMDYLMLADLNVTNGDIPIDFDVDSMYTQYMGNKREVYEDYLTKRKSLKVEYGLNYKQ